MLWFAFNLLSLTYWKQRSTSNNKATYCCDLLSIYYLWHTENNHISLFRLPYKVVICFQSIIFDILKTTWEQIWKCCCLLWFAFNLLSLTYWKQPGYDLSFSIRVIFDILKTTMSHSPFTKRSLWFAFNLLSLTYWKQHWNNLLQSLFRCDLLSIYYLWHTENNFL